MNKKRLSGKGYGIPRGVSHYGRLSGRIFYGFSHPAPSATTSTADRRILRRSPILELFGPKNSDSRFRTRRRVIGPYPEKGMVLIFTLVMLAVLSALVINLSSKVNQEVLLLKNSTDELKTLALAQGGINYGIAILETDEDLKVDGLGEDWAKRQELIFEDGIVAVDIEDESRRINLNYLDAKNKKEKNLRIEQMFELCDNIGLEYSIIPAIIDWIDADEEVSVLLSVTKGENEGAESDYYTQLPVPYPCKNSPFDTVEEIMMVKDISKENYYGEKGLKHFVTVSTSGKININTAPAEVLKSTLQAAVSSSVEEETESVEIIDDVLIGTITDWRLDNLFDDLSLLEDFLSKETVKKIVNSKLFDVKSDFFIITSSVKIGKIERKITALVERKESEIEIKSWNEN